MKDHQERLKRIRALYSELEKQIADSQDLARTLDTLSAETNALAVALRTEEQPPRSHKK